MARTRNWCWTINGDEEQLIEWNNRFSGTAVQPEDQAKLRFYIYQPEEAGRLHIQGFAQFIDATRMSSAKRVIGMGLVSPHMEPMKGTVDEAIDYCQKEDTFAEHDQLVRVMRGTPVSTGQRKDLEQLAAAVVDRSMSVRDVAEQCPGQFVRFHRGLQALADLVSLPYSGGAKEVSVYYGPTGTGKTMKAFTDHPDAYFWGPEQNKWFQGYAGQDVCIMDEFRGQLPLGFILRLTDRYPMIVEMKGSSTQFVSSRIIFCSPAHPKHWYQSLNKSDGKIDQLLRRITEVKWFGDGPEPDPDEEVVLPQFD